MEKGLGLVLGTAVISGVSIFLNKFGVGGMDPAVFTTAKNVLVAVFLISTLLALKEWKTLKSLSGKAWGQLALIGLIGGSIPFLLFFTGLQMTSAAQAGFLHTLAHKPALGSNLHVHEIFTRGIKKLIDKVFSRRQQIPPHKQEISDTDDRIGQPYIAKLEESHRCQRFAQQ